MGSSSQRQQTRVDEHSNLHEVSSVVVVTFVVVTVTVAAVAGSGGNPRQLARACLGGFQFLNPVRHIAGIPIRNSNCCLVWPSVRLGLVSVA